VNQDVSGLTIGGINLSDSGSGGYTIGTGTPGGATAKAITLDNGSLNSAITVNSGIHTIGSPLDVVGKGLAVTTTNSADRLSITGGITAPATSDFTGQAIGLTKSGAGTLTLAGTNTYTGATAVNGGTLDLVGMLTGTDVLSVNAGAALALSGTGGEQLLDAAHVTLAGGRLAFNNPANQVETLGVLSLGLGAGSTLDFGADSSHDTFHFSGLGSIAPGSILSILNWDGIAGIGGSDGFQDRLIFGGDGSEFTLGQNEVFFNGLAGYSLIGTGGSSYEVVGVAPAVGPVPEPACTAFVASLALCALGLRRRRRSAGMDGGLAR
jgi:MYXO-CTERM domain-containing protein